MNYGADSRVLNSQFLENITGEGQLRKQAQVTANSFIRSKLRESSFVRRIFTPIAVTEDELVPSVHTDDPMIIIEKEPDSRATFVPFKSSPQMNYFHAQRYQINFAKIQSDTFTKNIHELKTIRTDIRQVLNDNSVKDIHTQEDKHFIEACESIVNSSSSQNLDYTSTGFTRESYIDSLKALPSLQLPHACSLMSAVTAKDVLKWDANDIGDSAATQQYREGLGSMNLFGVKTIYSIKNDLIPDGVVWHFTSEEFLGKFFVLLEPTLFVESKRDMISFDTHEVIGLGIGNTNGIIKATFS